MSVLAPALACIACLHTPSSRAADASPQLRDKIIATTQSLMDAVGEGRKDVWQRTLADDAVVIDEFCRIQHKREAVDALRPFPPGFSGSIEVRDGHVQQYGDTAVLQAEAYERETVYGQKLVVRYLMLITYVKQAGMWKLVGYQDVTLPTPPPKLEVVGLHFVDYVGSYRYRPDRAWSVSVRNGVIGYTTKVGGAFNRLDPVAKDVFMGADDEKNLLIFRRDRVGHVNELIERRKFNDLHLRRDAGA
jgi:hypothetical protein